MTYGVYEHYKGGIYRVMGAAKHTETGEKLVVYKNLQGEIFVRPFDMFFENVDVDGKVVPRFKYLGDITE